MGTKKDGERDTAGEKRGGGDTQEVCFYVFVNLMMSVIA